MGEKKILTWDEYFLSLAHLSGKRSKDPNTQVGAVIVDDKNRIVSIGYNGMPRGCYDDQFPWGREGSYLETKYAYVVHAELNAILNSYRPVEGCTIYVSLFPCNECAKAIIQSGIKAVFYESDKYADQDNFIASRKMLLNAGVALKQLDFKVDIDVTIIENAQ